VLVTFSRVSDCLGRPGFAVGVLAATVSFSFGSSFTTVGATADALELVEEADDNVAAEFARLSII
jgi:hypothetical protein